jgi:two-component system, OmpR family, KDP operon response regulator KdpE
VKGLILVIGTEPHITQQLATDLSARGYDTEVALCARQGLESAARRSPDLVLVDPDLPDSKGADIVRRLRSQCQAPIVVLSGSARSKDQIDALDAGADDYLSKPFVLDELLARVRAAARRASKASLRPSWPAAREPDGGA